MTAQVLNCIIPIALKETMESLGPQFEMETGHQLSITYMLNPEVPGFIAKGAIWDIAMTNPWHIDEIIASGHAHASSHKLLGRSPLAFAKRGASKAPMLNTAEEIAEMLSEVSSIAITDVGTSGDMFRNLARTLGIWDDVESAIRPMEGGAPIRELVAGNVEMATVPLTNIATIEGITAVAACPEALNVHIDLSLCLHPNCAQGAKDLSAWLSSYERDQALKSLGVYRINT